MAKKMLIDATHPEEVRVAVMDGEKLVEFEYESKFRKPIKGSIFLAKVTRVEPSLQAAFVNFGGNRHGFLPFSEIHPDYFRIPMEDREALMAEQEEMLRKHEEALAEREAAEREEEQHEAQTSESSQDEEGADQGDDLDEPLDHDHHDQDSDLEDNIGNMIPEDEEEIEDNIGNVVSDDDQADDGVGNQRRGGRDGRGRGGRGRGRGRHNGGKQFRGRRTEKYSDEHFDPEERFRFNLRRKYKIQEVIKRGQIVLVQASKEERGNKGAAFTTYLSLPGRYCVLMPNSPRGGGVSRKIANYKDRAKMRELLKELEVPKGMSVIVRTAGVERTKAEVKRDLDYLMRLWDNIRELTLESSAPSLVYEEADLIKRAVRDLYSKDIDEIEVSGEEGYNNAKNFMKMMIPSHVKKVSEYKNDTLPLFNKYKAEGQIADIGEVQVTLPSGGYLVINPTEALVSIDVNSGRATKERHIEETALKTNLEAAEEVARQLRLRDLGGLVVIDFIDMEDRRNNAKVERKMREALSLDRARVQHGRISSFGLMELSRQRLNPSLTESQYETCRQCLGLGRVRSADATSIMVLRAIEEEGMKNRAAQVIVHVPNEVALYMLNNKRKHLSMIEERYEFQVMIRVDDSHSASSFRIEVSKPSDPSDADDAEDDDDSARGKDGDQSEKSSDKRRSRRGGRRHSSRKDDEAKDKNSDMTRDDENHEEKESKPSASKEDVKADEAKVEDVLSEKPPAKKPAAKKAPAKKAKAKANDDAEVKKAPQKRAISSVAYEVVSEAPKEKKKGWWSKD